MSRRPWPAWVVKGICWWLMPLLRLDTDLLMLRLIPGVTGAFLVTGLLPTEGWVLGWALATLSVFGLGVAGVGLKAGLIAQGWTPVTLNHVNCGRLPSLGQPVLRAFWAQQGIVFWRDVAHLGFCSWDDIRRPWGLWSRDEVAQWSQVNRGLP